MSVFEDIRTGLNQAIEYEKNNVEANSCRLSTSPVFHKSKYNYVCDGPDSRKIVFNTLTGNVMLFTPEVYQRFERENPTNEELSVLIKMGFYIVDNSSINDTMSIENCVPKQKVARIWTTSCCNANCFYCFEKGIPPVTLTDETAQKIVDFIAENVVHDKDEKLSIEWFGGEPLFNTHAIDFISEGLEKRGIDFSSFIITNGSLVTDEIIEKMKHQWKTTGVQITLDGFGEEYDQIKDYNNKSLYCYETVMGKIDVLLKNQIHVAIRLNYTGDNSSSLEKLVDDLHTRFGYNKYLSAYIYPIWSCTNTDIADRFVSSVSADSNIMDVFEKICNYKLNTIETLGRLRKRGQFCMTCNEYSFAFFPDGTVGKCSEAMNVKIGSVDDGIIDKNSEKIWTQYTPPEKCKDCNLFPICLGGCPTFNHLNMPICHPFKNLLPEILALYVKKEKPNQTWR